MSSDIPIHPLDDSQLVVRLTRTRREDDENRDARDAFEELYRRYAPRLLAFLAARVPRSEVEDLHQTVWMRVWQHAPKQFHGGIFRAWLFRIARNAAIDLARRPNVKTDDCLDARVDPRLRGGLEDLLDEERRKLLARCLERLNELRREVVRGRLAGDSYPELAERLGMIEARLHQLYHRAVSELRVCVGEVSP